MAGRLNEHRYLVTPATPGNMDENNSGASRKSVWFSAKLSRLTRAGMAWLNQCPPDAADADGEQPPFLPPGRPTPQRHADAIEAPDIAGRYAWTAQEKEKKEEQMQTIKLRYCVTLDEQIRRQLATGFG
ncbi:hypothetical protein FJU30_09580 [Affinibrenneria salicis]|uniref:Uncharacterized protein n=1 Tax=Affinibrenneria salicis TaxID=2590031 RepID=A0A5J5G1D4_9GAMM|nr:hypothetical protein [Affinibrenneria salicis]KAA9000485.1 hypothetical protein FJU30_09580 [Affinibrenneria salicis]